jgi:hypothetical protein
LKHSVISGVRHDDHKVYIHSAGTPDVSAAQGNSTPNLWKGFFLTGPTSFPRVRYCEATHLVYCVNKDLCVAFEEVVNHFYLV